MSGAKLTTLPGPATILPFAISAATAFCTAFKDTPAAAATFSCSSARTIPPPASIARIAP